MFVSKPPINLFAGWWYLLNSEYRHRVRKEWRNLPVWLVTMQVASGACSVVFPLIVVGLLVFVFISRNL